MLSDTVICQCKSRVHCPMKHILTSVNTLYVNSNNGFVFVIKLRASDNAFMFVHTIVASVQHIARGDGINVFMARAP